MIKFSLIISIYAKESPIFLRQCLDSISAQTAKPDELIIVKDGPLTEELETVLIKYANTEAMQIPTINIIALPENVSQGPARAEGVKAAKYEWIAIMDSDDVCRPDRFAKQLKMIENDPELTLIGGQIGEFADDPAQTVATRTVPLSHEEIAEYAKKRNPLNQMTVILKRDSALNAGNYKYFPWFEDYDLWTRMIKGGAVCANHPDILTDARVGSGMYGRRRGTSYIRSEWRMQKQLKGLGFIGLAGFVRNVIVRIPARLLPAKLLATLYRTFAR